MLRLSWKNLRAHKRRLIGTSLSVIIGIAFLSGTFVFTDTLNKVFDDLFADVFEHTDAYVRSSNEIETGFGFTQRGRIPEETVALVAAVPGVREAVPDVTGFARIIGKDGDAVGQDFGPPTFGSSIVESSLQPWEVVEGRYPSGPDEMVMDKGSFDNGDFTLGDRARVNSQGGLREFTIVGVVRFGDADSPGGATFALFDLPTAQEFVGQPGQIDAVLVGGDGQSQEELAASIRETLNDPSIEVLTGQEITEENQSDVEEGLSFFNILLLVFAGIALFVSVFIIYNTFSIIVAQRQRETALLRAIGASRRQVVGSLLLESVFIGVIASLIGLLVGVALSQVLKTGLDAAGIDLPSGDLVILPRTVIVAIIVGVVVTVVASVSPAFQASRVPPVAAMRDVAVEHFGFSRRRLLVGLGITAIGIVGVAVGLAGEPSVLGLGIPLVFIGVFVLGPLISRPVARFVGAPLPKIKGITGTLARENAMRNPKRTARTAAALMVGVALVAGISVLASSIKSSIRDIFDQQFTGDFVISTQSFGFGGLSPELADRVNALPEVAAATGVRIGTALINGDAEALSVIDPTTAGQVFDLDMQAGSIEDLTDEGILISRDTAEDEELEVGSTLRLQMIDGAERTVTVQGVYGDDDLAGPFTISKGLWAQSGADQFDFSIYILTAPGVSDDEARAAIQPLADEYPAADLESRSEYIDSQASQIDTFVNLVYGLLALAVIIAVVGIANTLSLSVYERTRELGLIRAVGGSRRQVRGTIRWESVITALLGAVQGIVIGILLGYAVIVALRDEGLESFSVPVGALLVVVILAFVCGVVAAIRPARRAARMNVLAAIAHE